MPSLITCVAPLLTECLDPIQGAKGTPLFWLDEMLRGGLDCPAELNRPLIVLISGPPDLLDPKFLGGLSAGVTAAAFAGGGLWAALAGTAIAVGRAAISFGAAKVDGIDECRKTNYEVAYVHEIQKAFG